MLTRRDVKRLEGVDPRLVSVVSLAFSLWDDEFGGAYQLMVLEGVRTAARQADLYAQGRTAPGKIVTWTLKSKHITGQAVDIAPMKGAEIMWKDVLLFDRLADCMLKAAAELEISIRWGADWDGDGVRREKGESDAVHFELIG